MQGYTLQFCVAVPIPEDYASAARDRSIASPTYWDSRTPSPSLTRQQFPGQQVCGNFGMDENLLEDDKPTPRMQINGMNSWSCQPCNGMGMKTNAGAPVMQPVFFGAPQMFSIAQQPVQHDAGFGSPYGDEGRRNQTPGLYGEGCIAPVSAGSVGHPYRCAEACKYARKSRGCKDGAACVRCHLCEWKKKGVRKPVQERERRMRVNGSADFQ